MLGPILHNNSLNSDLSVKLIKFFLKLQEKHLILDAFFPCEHRQDNKHVETTIIHLQSRRRTAFFFFKQSLKVLGDLCQNDKSAVIET